MTGYIGTVLGFIGGLINWVFMGSGIFLLVVVGITLALLNSRNRTVDGDGARIFIAGITGLAVFMISKGVRVVGDLDATAIGLVALFICAIWLLAGTSLITKLVAIVGMIIIVTSLVVLVPHLPPGSVVRTFLVAVSGSAIQFYT